MTEALDFLSRLWQSEIGTTGGRVNVAALLVAAALMLASEGRAFLFAGLDRLFYYVMMWRQQSHAMSTGNPFRPEPYPETDPQPRHILALAGMGVLCAVSVTAIIGS